MPQTDRNVLFIAGTRPEAIKLAPVIDAMRHDGRLTPVLCATAQHRDLLDQVLAQFDLEPAYDLNIMRPGQALSELTARLFMQLPEVLRDAEPAAVVVQGDTTTVFAASVCAFYERIPVAHVEAGLRSGDIYAPFPEEINRRLTSAVTRWHFAPTTTARDNLMREGVAADTIEVTGNTVIDALLATAAKAPPLPAGLRPAPGRRLVLVTGHRRESFGPGMRQVALALAEIARATPDVEIVYPVHPNPNVRAPMEEILGGMDRVRLVAPVGYAEFVALMREAHIIITDSGGVQEEAPALGKPVLVTREVTERPEAVEAGCARLVGTDTATILSAARTLLDDADAYRAMAHAANPFGDGHASTRIVERLAADIADGAAFRL